MTLKIPHIAEMPIFILVRALGIEFDREIIDCVTQGSQDIGLIEMARVSLDNSIDEFGNKIISKEAAINYLISKMKMKNTSVKLYNIMCRHTL